VLIQRNNAYKSRLCRLLDNLLGGPHFLNSSISSLMTYKQLKVTTIALKEDLQAPHHIMQEKAYGIAVLLWGMLPEKERPGQPASCILLLVFVSLSLFVEGV